VIPRSKRAWVLAAVFAVALATAFLWVPKIAPHNLGDRDFIVYYASGRLALQQHNPYDPVELFAIEKSLGYAADHVTYPREPPWLLWTLIPFGLLSPMWGWALWLAASIAALLLASRLCWRMQQWPITARRPFVYATYLFAPVLACLVTSQMGFFMMLALVLVLACEPKRDFWAGAALVLPAIKPQLLAIFWIVQLVWIIHRKRWRLALGAASAFAAASLLAVAMDPAVFSHWYEASVHSAEPIAPLLVPSLSGIFRAVFFRRAFWVQFVPAGLGMVWGVWYYWHRRREWNWRTHGLALALASFVVTPYEWFTDEVLVLPAILQATLWIYRARASSARRIVAAGVLVALDALLLMMVLSKVPFPLGVYFWSPLVWLGWWRLGWRGHKKVTQAPELASSTSRATSG